MFDYFLLTPQRVPKCEIDIINVYNNMISGITTNIQKIINTGFQHW